MLLSAKRGTGSLLCARREECKRRRRSTLCRFYQSLYLLALSFLVCGWRRMKSCCYYYWHKPARTVMLPFRTEFAF